MASLQLLISGQRVSDQWPVCHKFTIKELSYYTSVDQLDIGSDFYHKECISLIYLLDFLRSEKNRIEFKGQTIDLSLGRSRGEPWIVVTLYLYIRINKVLIGKYILRKTQSENNTILLNLEIECIYKTI